MSNIVVLVKQVPDTYSVRKLTDTDFTLDRESADAVLDEINENAVEAALQIKEAGGDYTITVLSMGPERATDAIRKALALGCDEAIHVVDDNLKGSDVLGTAWTLSQALNLVDDVALIVTGNASTDGSVGAVPALISEYRQIPALTHLRSVEVADGVVRGESAREEGVFGLEAPLPAIVSVTEKANEPRFAAFKGIAAARKKEIRTVSLAEIGVDPSNVGLAAAATGVTASAPKPAKSAGQIIRDEGDGGVKLVEFLAEQKLI